MLAAEREVEPDAADHVGRTRRTRLGAAIGDGTLLEALVAAGGLVGKCRNRGVGNLFRHRTGGELLAQGKSNIDAWWISLSTFGVLVVTLLLLTFMGEALRDALDPRQINRDPGA